MESSSLKWDKYYRNEVIQISTQENNNSKEASRSWFCVLNNPQSVFPDLEKPEDMVQAAIDKWCFNKPYRTCAVNYEIGDNGNHHMHMVLEDPSKSRFSAVQKLFPGIHIERTRGNKEQAEDYILKRGRFSEKGHTVIVPAQFKGQIKANQGKRSDLDAIQELIEQGMSPNQIMDLNIHYRNHETIIKKAYFSKRFKETPPKREVKVYWHCGESGSGKTFEYTALCEMYGEENVYLLNDYDKGGFDNYCGEKILCMDEFRGQMRFALLMNLLDGYKVQIPCRYTNSYALWEEIHIFTVLPPEMVYKNMVAENRNVDTIEQLFRRITSVIYHYKNNGDYCKFSLAMSEYSNYEDLKNRALGAYDFREASKAEQLVFND